MKTAKTKPIRSDDASQSDQVLYLTGITRLADFITYVRQRTIGGLERDTAELSDAWRKAARLFESMQLSEAGIADNVSVLALPKALQSHVKKLAKLSHFQQTFSSVPVAFGLVELDKLVVYQQHIMSSAVLKMTQTLTPDMNHTAMADLCLPLTQADTGFRMVSQDDGRFIFLSDNHDARFQGAQLVKPSDIKGLKINGYSQAVVALSVGFTTNVLNVVRYGSRMVLNNGYHRAFALRQMGVTHAPCLIQVCEHWEDVGLVGSREMVDNSTIYFSAARPPLLRDFANPALIQLLPAKTWRKEIRISFESDSARLEL